MNQCIIVETSNGWYVKSIHKILDDEEIIRVFEISEKQSDAKYETFAKMLEYVSQAIEPDGFLTDSEPQKSIKFSYEVVDQIVAARKQ